MREFRFFRDLILPRKIFPLAEHISRGGKGPEGGRGSRDGCSRFTPCLFSAARSLMSELNKHQRRGSGPNPTPEKQRRGRNVCVGKSLLMVFRERRRGPSSASVHECVQVPLLPPTKTWNRHSPHLLYSWNFHNQTDIHTVPLLSLSGEALILCACLSSVQSPAQNADATLRPSRDSNGGGAGDLGIVNTSSLPSTFLRHRC